MAQRYITRKSNKALLASLRNASLLLVVTAVTACSSLPEYVTGVTTRHEGYAPGDPCIRCGESWVMLPNSSSSNIDLSKYKSEVKVQTVESKTDPQD